MSTLHAGSTVGHSVGARELQAGEEEPGPPQVADREERIVGFEGEAP